MAFSWLINGGGPNYLLTGMILQVFPGSMSIFRREKPSLKLTEEVLRSKEAVETAKTVQ